MEKNKQNIGIKYIKLDDSIIEQYLQLKNVVEKFFDQENDYKKKWNCTFDSSKTDIFCDVGYCNFSNLKELFQVRLGEGMNFPEELRSDSTKVFKLLENVARKWIKENCSNYVYSTIDTESDVIESQKNITASVLKFTRYQIVKDGFPENQHEDSGLITISVLPEPGLQVLNIKSNKWEDVICPKDCNAVIYYGSMLSHLTNGKYPATVHRVNRTDRIRNSIIFFLRQKPELFPPRTEGDFQLLKRRNATDIRLNINNLPFDILASIFLFLDIKEIAACFQVCTLWNKISESDVFWKYLSKTHFPKVEYDGSSWKEHYKTVFFMSENVNPIALHKYKKLKYEKERGLSHIKMVIVGNDTIGKTCFLTTYTTNSFPGDYIFTGFDNFSSNEIIEGRLLNVGLWDTHGQLDYDRLRPLSYPSTDIFLLAFSVVDPKSLYSIRDKFASEVDLHCPYTVKILVGLKTDLRHQYLVEGKPIVTAQEAKEVASQTGCLGYSECASINYTGIKETIHFALRTYFQYQKHLEEKYEKKSKCVVQ